MIGYTCGDRLNSQGYPPQMQFAILLICPYIANSAMLALVTSRLSPSWGFSLYDYTLVVGSSGFKPEGSEC